MGITEPALATCPQIATEIEIHSCGEWVGDTNHLHVSFALMSFIDLTLLSHPSHFNSMRMKGTSTQHCLHVAAETLKLR